MLSSFKMFDNTSSQVLLCKVWSTGNGEIVASFEFSTVLGIPGLFDHNNVMRVSE